MSLNKEKYKQRTVILDKELDAELTEYASYRHSSISSTIAFIVSRFLAQKQKDG